MRSPIALFHASTAVWRRRVLRPALKEASKSLTDEWLKKAGADGDTIVKALR